MTPDHWWGPESRWINTASNAAYPLVGLALGIMQGTPMARAFAATLLALGIGSGLYHWYGGPKTRALDWLGMILVLAGLATVAASPDDPNIWWVLLAVAAAVSLLLIYGFRRVGDDIALGMIVALALIPPLFGDAVSRILAGAALAAFLLAKVAHNADNHGVAWVGRWGHAIWHCLSAVAFGLLYLAQL